MDPCTLTTEYSDQTTPAVNIALENESDPQIPDFAIERMAKFFLSRMQAELAEKANPSD